MTAPFPAYGQLGLLAPADQGYGIPAPFQPKMSIVDRIAARLFPSGAYQGLLSPQDQQGLQRQSLLNLGTSLLQQSGPSPYRIPLGAAIGNALQQSQQGFPQMAERALQLQAYRSQLAQQQAIAQAAQENPPQPNETPADTYARVSRIAGRVATMPGGGPIAKDLAAVAQALRPGAAENRNDWSITAGVGPDGLPKLYRINRLTGEVRDTGLGKPETPKEPTPAERVAASQYGSAQQSIDAMRAIAARNPNAVKQAVAAIKAAKYGAVGSLITEARGSLTDPDAQNFFTHYNNMLLTVTPTYGASRPTQQLMDLEKNATLPAIGSGDFATAFTHMENRLKDIQAKAGKALGPQPKGHTAPAAEPSGFDEFLDKP